MDLSCCRQVFVIAYVHELGLHREQLNRGKRDWRDRE